MVSQQVFTLLVPDSNSGRSTIFKYIVQTTCVALLRSLENGSSVFKYGSNTKQTYLRSDDVIGQQSNHCRRPRNFTEPRSVPSIK